MTTFSWQGEVRAEEIDQAFGALASQRVDSRHRSGDDAHVKPGSPNRPAKKTESTADIPASLLRMWR
jgi:hypothetical protein